MLADRSQLKTAIFNLIDNAVKYGEPGVPIDLAITSEDARIGIMVADQGPGIAAEEQESIRLKFRRGSAGAGRTGGGIGLYLVERIAAEHGGSLELRPNTPRGTVAIFFLPACS